ncbi:hypothetical protein [Neorhizobium alkalisoli]|uniref:Uncharacterized protein n=1 Tax=Neorhizobium alkalisoli TaxID=528178 RepID=A0A561Q132_9HYPH|nr:hypothetical protein [Neorhizobium alkalisoli]TWF44025.1 hypothetical protein FHW37_11629 [Neorhizobium alkalisoli]
MTSILVKLTGDDDLWFVDLEKGSAVLYTEPLSGNIHQAAEFSAADGAAVTKGVDLAIAIHSAVPAASGLLEG